ncbi:hypothetical protein ACH5RR_039032 [Cinchona calisaya]|uniref:Disease resistance protein RPM1-like n=1 Tax=Cinchona calisaya TaxID=153742 RepID=A0ABD2Y2K1_9GENT
MAEAMVTFLLDQLKILLAQKSTILGTGGLQEDFEYINDELGQMRASLKVVDEQEETEPQLQEWVKQVRDAAYDAEDVLDEFMIHFASYSTDGYGFFAQVRKRYASIKNLRALRRITHKMRDVESKVNDVSERHQRYQHSYRISKHGNNSCFDGVKKWYDSRGDALLQEEEHLVGIERSKQEILQLLLADGSAFRVRAVAGMGGLGKTTLVKKAYDDVLVQKHSNHLVWVNVLESFQVKSLLRKIIEQLIKEIKKPAPKEFEEMDSNMMKQFIKDLLQDRSYIIVLDDIWHHDAWEAIKLAFPTRNHASRVLITTRSDDVALTATAESSGVVYHLQFLSYEDSCRLFNKNAFPGSSCPPYLEEITHKILKRCDGLLLAIVVTGGLLATKNDRIEEWETFYRNFGAELNINNKLERITRLLSLR